MRTIAVIVGVSFGVGVDLVGGRGGFRRARPPIARGHLAFTLDFAYQHWRGCGMWTGRAEGLPSR